MSPDTKVCPLPTGLSLQENLENRHNEEKQMTTKISSLIGASSACPTWDAIRWRQVATQVRRLQMRIAKAIQEGRYGKAKALQWLLTHSFNAKLLAVKRVTKNRGSKTAGIDKVIWKTSRQKINAARSLQRRGYQAQPLKRIYIPKKNGSKRPLHIPTMKCRAMQALYLLALEPIAEIQADKNSYGFRPKRSTADAIGHCFYALARSYAPQWIFEGDIKSCFDRISHSWIMENIPTDKILLAKWLAAGYIEQKVFHPTEEGVPQGAIISPTIMNMTLSGLQNAVTKTASKQDKVHTIIYADDFIITGTSKELLENKIKPVVVSFLKERGLEISEEKSKITHVDEGFDFLGCNVRKYKEKLLIKPTRKDVLSFLNEIRLFIKSNLAIKTDVLIRLLNSKIRGWANYYRHIVAKKTFAYVDYHIFRSIIKWIKRRHPNKSAKWHRKRYFRREGFRNWIFHDKSRDKNGNEIFTDLFLASSIPIKRHLKIRGEATPYDQKFKEYFEKRENLKKNNKLNLSL